MARLGPPLSQQKQAPSPLQLVVAVLDALLRCHRCASALQQARHPPLPQRLGGASPRETPAHPPSAYPPRPSFPSACSVGGWGAGLRAPALAQHHTQRQVRPLPALPRQGWGGMAAPAKCHPSSNWRKGAAMQSPPCSSVVLSSPWVRGRGCGKRTQAEFYLFIYLFSKVRCAHWRCTPHVAAFTPTAHYSSTLYIPTLYSTDLYRRKADIQTESWLRVAWPSGAAGGVAEVPPSEGDLAGRPPALPGGSLPGPRSPGHCHR